MVGGGFEIYRGGKRRCGRVGSQGKLASHISNGLELVGTMINILNPFFQLVQTMINILNWVGWRGETDKHLKLVKLRGKDDKQAAPAHQVVADVSECARNPIDSPHSGSIHNWDQLRYVALTATG